MPVPVQVFLSYAEEDKELKDKLARHLKLITQNGEAKMWCADDILGGQDREQVTQERFETAHIFIPLISSDFLNSDYHYQQLETAIERREAGQVTVVPVLLRHIVDTELTPFKDLKILPSNEQPATSWTNLDEALQDIAQGVYKITHSTYSTLKTPPAPQPTPENTERKTRYFELTISGKFEETNFADIQQIQQELFRKLKNINIKIVEADSGSIKLIFEGSEEDLKLLEALIQSGQLTEVSDRTIENVKFIEEETKERELRNKLDIRNRLVQEIRSQTIEGRNLEKVNLKLSDLSGIFLKQANLSGADLSLANLSDADLSGAYLSGADLRNTTINEETKLDDKWRLVQEIVTQGAEGRDLSGADLSRADLSGAYLSGAYLSGADLSGADLWGADLSGAYLSGADLSGADLIRAKVEKARFGGNSGISKSMKRDLIQRGAIFEDSPPDDRFKSIAV